jgi:hypothetical protein
MIVRALPAGRVGSSHREPSESDVVHVHIRLGEYEISTVARVGSVGARRVKHAGTAYTSETMRGSAGSCEFSPGGDSTEMISNGCPDPNGKVLV